MYRRKNLRNAVKFLDKSIGKNNKGSNAYYSRIYHPLHGWSNPYPETTGYIIPTLINLSKNNEYYFLEKSIVDLSNWLLSIQNKDGSFNSGLYPNNKENKSIFNTAQIIIGLLAAKEHLKEDRFFDAANKAAIWLSNNQEDDGSCAYELDCNGACGGPLLNTCIGGGGDDQSTCETAGGYWSVSGYDICEVCAGTDTDSDQCFCTEENIIYDCNGDCPPIEDCPNEFSFTEGCAFQDTNCSDVCVGGATERYPCEQDCVAILLSTEEWGGIAYEDNCGVCISNTVETVIPEVLDSLDCFKSSFSIFNSNGIEINDLIVKESDTIYVVLHMQNLPNSLEGLILNIDYNSNDLFLNNWSVDPEEFNLEGALTGELDNSIELYVDIDSTFIDSTIFTAVIYAPNEPYQENGGNILFLEFATLGNNGDSTVLNYNEVQINEHVMKEQNYTSQVFYIGDCNGIFNGDTPPDDCGICGGGNADMDQCGVCFGPGTIYECGCENIPEGTCDCDGNTPADLYGGEGYNCEGEELSINEILIPKSFELSQNYPNPFNPITYIQYSIPHYDFITIDIINISGQIIKTVVQSSHQPGNYEIMWDGTNQYGISVPSGIYFYKLDADEFISVKKLVLLK